jgi:hypothetical protein
MAGTSVTPIGAWSFGFDRGRKDGDVYAVSIGKKEKDGTFFIVGSLFGKEAEAFIGLYDYAASEHERAESQRELALAAVASGATVADRYRAERDEARQVAMQLLRLARAAVRELSVYEEASVTCPTGADMATWLRAWATLGDARDDAYFALSPALRRLVEE